MLAPPNLEPIPGKESADIQPEDEKQSNDEVPSARDARLGEPRGSGDEPSSSLIRAMNCPIKSLLNFVKSTAPSSESTFLPTLREEHFGSAAKVWLRIYRLALCFGWSKT